MWSLSECIPWMTVGLAECVAIVTLNLRKLIIFIRNRNLRKRSTYLVINLAVIDMFVGGFAVYNLFHVPGSFCELWKRPSIESGAFLFLAVFVQLFPIGSTTNITFIALERLHATYCPYRHRVLRKCVYGIIITVAWVIAGSVAIAFALLVHFRETYYQRYLMNACFFIFLLIICVSYTSIVIKVRCGAQPRHHGAASRERKLTMTLLIVTVVSLLLYLPIVVFWLTVNETLRSLPPSVRVHLHYALVALFYANSLVNPILYTIRMPEYRSAFLALFRKRPQQQRQVVVLPLRGMQII